jgi:uncharacterized membrane protein
MSIIFTAILYLLTGSIISKCACVASSSGATALQRSVPDVIQYRYHSRIWPPKKSRKYII